MGATMRSIQSTVCVIAVLLALGSAQPRCKICDTRTSITLARIYNMDQADSYFKYATDANFTVAALYSCGALKNALTCYDVCPSRPGMIYASREAGYVRWLQKRYCDTECNLLYTRHCENKYPLGRHCSTRDYRLDECISNLTTQLQPGCRNKCHPMSRAVPILTFGIETECGTSDQISGYMCTSHVMQCFEPYNNEAGFDNNYDSFVHFPERLGNNSAALCEFYRNASTCLHDLTVTERRMRFADVTVIPCGANVDKIEKLIEKWEEITATVCTAEQGVHCSEETTETLSTSTGGTSTATAAKGTEQIATEEDPMVKPTKETSVVGDSEVNGETEQPTNSDTKPGQQTENKPNALEVGGEKGSTSPVNVLSVKLTVCIAIVALSLR